MSTVLNHRRKPQVLSGGAVLPGFKVKVADIFSVLDEL
jgi:hypothetical protein